MVSASVPVLSTCRDFPNDAFGLGVSSRHESPPTRAGAEVLSQPEGCSLFLPLGGYSFISFSRDGKIAFLLLGPCLSIPPPPLYLLYGFWQLISMEGQMVCISGSLEQSVPVTRTQLCPSSSKATV